MKPPFPFFQKPRTLTVNRQPITWRLKNPYTLPMVMTMRADGVVTAEFPALPGCVAEGKNADEALLHVVRMMQSVLERHGEGEA